jgi:hypothetical protein
MFYKPYNINTSNIIFKKQIIPHFISIKYKLDKSNDITDNLVFQTPIMFLPFGISNFNNKYYIDMSFMNQTKSKDIDQLKNFVIKINTYFKNIKCFKKCNYISSFKESDFFPPTLKLNYNLNNNIQVFNDDNINITEKITSEPSLIKPKLFAKFIIQASNIWFNNGKYGIIWNICQIKLYNNLIYTPQSFSFIDDNDYQLKVTNKEKYSKYFDMLKKGVPLFAIKQKLIIDKLNPNIIDKPKDIVINNNSNNSNNSNNINKTNIGDKSMILNSIVNKNFKLKKNNINTKDNKKMYKSKSLIVPSKLDIINAMNKLKNINKL